VGCSYYAIGGIGLKLDLDAIELPSATVESCDHPERIGHKFCPSCGKKVEQIAKTYDDLPAFLDDWFEDAVRAYPHFIWERLDHEAGREYFLGYGATISSYRVQNKSFLEEDMPSFADIRATLYEIVAIVTKSIEDRVGTAPDDYFDFSSFGLHVIQRISC
jgi:hypothetical protein